MAKDWNALIGGVTEEVSKSETADFSSATSDEQGPTEASFNINQVTELCRTSLDFLAATAMPTVFAHKFPPVLLAAWMLLVQLVTTTASFPQLALGIPRGHGKTTLIKLFVLFCILFTKKKFILVVSSTSTLAENIVADIFDFLNEPNIKNIFGWWGIGIEMDRQDLKKFGFRGRNIVVAAIGAGGSLRGLNLKNERPDIIIFEDIQTKECSESQVQSESLERWMVGTAMKAKSPKGCLTIFCGNMFPGPHSILKKLKKNKNWISFTTGAILSDGTALWEKLRPLSSLIEEFENDISMGHPEIFFSEVLNETEVNLNTKVDLSHLATWKWSDLEFPQGKFIIIDPATGKINGDAVTIMYVEVFDETPGVREVDEGIYSPGTTILKGILMALRHQVPCIAIESNGYQSTLGYWFGKETERLQIHGINCVEVYNNHTSKNSRISTVLKSLNASEIVLHDDVKNKVLYQVSNWNMLKRDNVDGILDCLTYIPAVMNNFPEMIISEEGMLLVQDNGARVVENNHAF